MQLREDTKVKKGEEEAAFKPKTLLPFMKRVPVKRVVHLPNITGDPIKFSLQYNMSQGASLPPGAASDEMASYTLTGDTLLQCDLMHMHMLLRCKSFDTCSSFAPRYSC